jgi:hypothetical protein
MSDGMNECVDGYVISLHNEVVKVEEERTSDVLLVQNITAVWQRK